VDEARPTVLGPVRAGRGGRGPFAALLARATEDGDAASGLALGYEQLTPGERRCLVDVVRSDASAEGLDPAPLLLALLSVEPDLEIARAIAAALAHESGPVAAGAAEARLREGSGRGAAALIQPLHGSFVEAWAVRWDGASITGSHFFPMVTSAVLEEELGRFAGPLEPVPMQDTVDRVATLLWPHLRGGGRAPRGLARFAGLFSIEPGAAATGG
jgi:hypothetical protein